VVVGVVVGVVGMVVVEKFECVDAGSNAKSEAKFAQGLKIEVIIGDSRGEVSWERQSGDG
jgi:hypothetical protein